ncbi:recombination regulator RecX [Lutibacter sp. B2]|nr:recombination regulator RecX [Lutibacter sp. B2]
MPIITKLEIQQKDKKRVSIYVDDEFFMGVNEEIIYSLYIQKGQEIDNEKLQKMIAEENYLKAKSKALKLLHFSSRTEKEIRDRLRKNEYEDDTIDRVIVFLKEYEFINDEYLTKNMINNKLNNKKYGSKRIKQDLQRKGVDASIIESSMEDYVDEEIEYENAILLAEKKLKGLKDDDPRKIYEKVGRYLAYRGYNYDIIRKVLNTVLKR